MKPVRLSVVVPATNRPATLPGCLDAIKHAEQPPEQVIVVDDTSIKHPATARNAGVRQSNGDVLVFVDADVIVHRDAFAKIRRAFDTDPTLTALFGSYDDAPAARSVVSVFRNLLHHYVHQHSAGPASTFWAGLGAMRRDAFESAGGFSVHPIEDIELGMRLSGRGARILLDPTIQGTHLKRWTLYSMVRTDLMVRGIPWVGLLLDHRDSPSVLNLTWRHRLSALTSVAVLAALALRNVWLIAATVALLVALNFDFYRFLMRIEGLPRAIAGVALHWIHHLTSVAAVPLGILAHYSRRRRAPARVVAT